MITLIVFYYLYLLIVLIFVIFSLFNLYHLLMFGFASSVNILVILLYLTVSALALISSFFLLSLIDWSLPLIDIADYKTYFPSL